jgi:uncharacterized repeat protein (TIGR03803 family)
MGETHRGGSGGATSSAGAGRGRGGGKEETDLSPDPVPGRPPTAVKTGGRSPAWAGVVGGWLLAAALAVFTVQPAGAISILKGFQGDASDGQRPWGALVGDGAGNLYGTTPFGGSSGGGTVFTVKTGGSGFAILHSFTGGPSDGADPYASLVLDGSGNLYGTTTYGGEFNAGTVFTIKADGTGFTVLHQFTRSDGANPYASLIVDGAGHLYGTTTYGGASDDGTVFTVKTDGSAFAVLHSFAGGAADGANPYGAPILDGSGNLHGTTSAGGASGDGTVFTMTTGGDDFTLVHSFAGGATDGATPYGSLVRDASGNLWGTTNSGGTSDEGTIFMIDGGGTLTVVHSFTGGASDGARPHVALILDGAGNLYGTTYSGGTSNDGTVFTIDAAVSTFTVLHSFAGNPTGGAHPEASLVLDGAGNLYGTTSYGGAADTGAVFTVTTAGTGFAILHSFAWGGTEASHPYPSLVLDGSGNLYGTTYAGGHSSSGVIFTLKTDGSGFTVLHSFAGGEADGANPYGALVLDGSGNLYGTTSGGGASGEGTIFTITTGGTGFTVLHSFAGGDADGANPYGALVLDGSGNLYGTTSGGGASGEGTIFTITTGGSGFAVLHSFAGGTTDGATPKAGLLFDGSNILYGTTSSGGASGVGTIFKVQPDGNNFGILHSFAGGSSDGADPEGSLVLDGSGNLYGTTAQDGASGAGTIFTYTTDSTFELLHSFAGGPSDGANPYASLALDGSGNLYGTAVNGGASGSYGVVFTVTTDGTGFALLHSFAGWATDGANPYASLILDGSGTLYGTTFQGGTGNIGTVFSLPTTGDLPPEMLAASKSGTGTGLVTSDPGGLNCGLTCSAWYVDSATVTVSALANTGSTFTGWSGEGCSGTGTCVVTMDTARSVTATFTLNTYALSVTKAGSGTGSVTSSPTGIDCGATCSASFDYDTPVTLSAAADADSTFAGWSGEGCSGTGNCQVTMTQARSVTATFTLNTYALTVTKAGTGTGTVTSSPDGIDCGATCSASFDAGTPVTLGAAADAGSTFTGWSGEGCSGTGTCVVTMDTARAVTATFTSCTVTLSDQTITDTETFTSCGTLTAGPAFRVESPGDVTLHAAVRIVLANGFSVGSGATFRAGIDPSLAP